MDPRLDTYLTDIARDMEEARDAMTRTDPGRAKRAIRTALARPHPPAVDPAETVALTALALGVVPPEPVADLAAARSGREQQR